jgi:hypothetical protein
MPVCRVSKKTIVGILTADAAFATVAIDSILRVRLRYSIFIRVEAPNTTGFVQKAAAAAEFWVAAQALAGSSSGRREEGG